MLLHWRLARLARRSKTQISSKKSGTVITADTTAAIIAGVGSMVTDTVFRSSRSAEGIIVGMVVLASEASVEGIMADITADLVDLDMVAGTMAATTSDSCR